MPRRAPAHSHPRLELAQPDDQVLPPLELPPLVRFQEARQARRTLQIIAISVILSLLISFVLFYAFNHEQHTVITVHDPDHMHILIEVGGATTAAPTAPPVRAP